MASIRVYPLHIGTVTRQLASYCYGLEPKIMDFPLICWLIEGSDKHILVDTGGGESSTVYPKFQPYKRENEQSIDKALMKFGLTCNDIELVIVTHLHWDHSGGNSLFPNAKLIVQKEELRIASNPFPIIANSYNREVVENIKYTVISGDTEVANGIQAILTPGHTYGLQGVLVQGEKRRIFIASDTYPIFENFRQNPPAMSKVFVDIKSYYRSMKKIANLSALVLPGHDFGVFEKEVYY